MTPKVILYLRKSTDEHQADSIDTQRTGAQRFVATSLGGEVIDEIVDEGESRAEFKRRPGFARLLSLCSARDRVFDTIVVRDESRLGAGARLTVALDDMIAAGVRVYYYANGEEVRLDSAEQKILTAVKSAVAENERAKTAERTREALERKAERGFNVGGRCYGYDNLRVVGSDGRTHTDYKVNEEQARIIVDIARRFAAGYKRRRRTELILAVRHQHIGKVHPRRLDINQHLGGTDDRLGYLIDAQARRTFQLMAADGTHGRQAITTAAAEITSNALRRPDSSSDPRSELLGSQCSSHSFRTGISPRAARVAVLRRSLSARPNSIPISFPHQPTVSHAISSRKDSRSLFRARVTISS